MSDERERERADETEEKEEDLEVQDQAAEQVKGGLLPPDGFGKK